MLHVSCSIFLKKSLRLNSIYYLSQRRAEQADPEGGRRQGQDPEGTVRADRPPAEDQRVPGAQDAGAQRVRQDDPGDGGRVHENSRIVADAAARHEA